VTPFSKLGRCLVFIVGAPFFFTVAAAQGRAAEPHPPTNVVDLPLPELIKSIPELRGLDPAKNQDQLSDLLTKIGDEAELLFHKMPNLLSHEEVLQSRNGARPMRQDCGYLILSHPTEKDVALDEYRFELQNKSQPPEEAFNPASVITGGAAVLADLERRSIEASTRNKGAFAAQPGIRQQLGSLLSRESAAGQLSLSRAAASTGARHLRYRLRPNSFRGAVARRTPIRRPHLSDSLSGNRLGRAVRVPHHAVAYRPARAHRKSLPAEAHRGNSIFRRLRSSPPPKLSGCRRKS